ncbi:MAG: B12-binding domain-containing radical SAM protein [Deltaproteobacteria bacterium]|nr:B12-binding domain-containing radical SAM protein [Deltaproteobacteria bacterium]
MRVLLLAPPWGEVYGRFRSLTRSLNLNPPLNLAWLTACANAHGHEVLIQDLEFMPRGDAPIRTLFHEFRPDVVGLTVTSPLVPVIARLAHLAREAKVRVIVGGPHATLVRHQCFDDVPDADDVMIGEGEENFVEYLNRLRDGRDLLGIPGLLVRGETDGGESDPPIVKDLESIPDPVYPGINFRNYLWSVKGRAKVPTQTIMSSRGCPYQCVFCSIEFLTGRSVRFRSAERVAEEMTRSIRERPVRHFVFVDDVMTLNKRRVHTLCDQLIASRLPETASWEADTRADAVDEELLAHMAAAGCRRINFGIESGDVDVLKGLNKRLELPRVVEALSLAKKAGMDTRGTAMIGNPGDTRDTIDRTITFLRDLPNLDQPYLSIAQPYPGTRLRDIALSGSSNLRVERDALAEMRRYGSSVMFVGDISPREMESLQRKSIFRMYLRPRRIWYNLTRTSLLDGFRLALGLLAGVLIPEKKEPAPALARTC